MGEMSVEEAVQLIERYHAWRLDNGMSDTSVTKAERVVLDELKALQECSSCKCDHANRGNDK